MNEMNLAVARPVRITIPASVAYDVKKLHKMVDDLANRFGCKPCFSGSDCHFLLERDFVVDPASGKLHGREEMMMQG